MKKKIVVGVSGASGIPIAELLLRELANAKEWETHLVMTNGACCTIAQETKTSVEEFKKLCDFYYNLNDIGASIASGTFETEGMVIVPCSMKTIAGIAVGYSENLLLRAADVTIKERRKLVLVARETPLSSIHLTNMLTLSNLGVNIMPPMQTYYNEPKSVEDMTYHMVGKIMNAFGIPCNRFCRWKSD